MAKNKQLEILSEFWITLYTRNLCVNRLAFTNDLGIGIFEKFSKKNEKFCTPTFMEYSSATSEPISIGVPNGFFSP